MIGHGRAGGRAGGRQAAGLEASCRQAVLPRGGKVSPGVCLSFGASLSQLLCVVRRNGGSLRLNNLGGSSRSSGGGRPSVLVRTVTVRVQDSQQRGERLRQQQDSRQPGQQQYPAGSSYTSRKFPSPGGAGCVPRYGCISENHGCRSSKVWVVMSLY
jgi:hypothetical protein